MWGRSRHGISEAKIWHGGIESTRGKKAIRRWERRGRVREVGSDIAPRSERTANRKILVELYMSCHGEKEPIDELNTHTKKM